jgi:predicted TIM-barrel fold metal-dependent hydrolase
MIDAHVHIGQFNEIWYEAELVIQTVLQAGVEKVAFSSTTSCRDYVNYSEVEKEISTLLSRYKCDSQKINPLLWYNPDYHNQGLGIEKAMQTLPYCGIKIHPRAHNWDISDKKTLSILDELFGYADQNKLPVCIHTGYDKIDEADKFSQFFPKYPHAKIVLAHCRPRDQVLQLLLDNNNLFFDTAFVDCKEVAFFFLRDLGSRIILGSDFPITHYMNIQKSDMETDFVSQLENQYNKDLQLMTKASILDDGLPCHKTNIVYFEKT